MSHDGQTIIALVKRLSKEIKKSVLKIAHLNVGISNKGPQQLFLSYINCLSVNSSPASDHASATSQANTVLVSAQNLNGLYTRHTTS